MKEVIPNATKLLPTPLWCQRAECYIVFSFSSRWLLHILSFLCFDPDEASSLAVWDSSCADPGMVFVGCLCYRRSFLHVTGKGLKALSAAGMPVCHFDVKLLSWKIRQHKGENCMFCKGLASAACICLVLYCQGKQTQSCLIGSLGFTASNKVVLVRGVRRVQKST